MKKTQKKKQTQTQLDDLKMKHQVETSWTRNLYY